MGESTEGTFGKDGNSTSTQQEGSQYLTRAEAERLKAEILEETSRKTQSLTDKLESRVDKKMRDGMSSVQKAIELANKAGTPLPPETIAVMKQQVINDAYAYEPDPAPNTTATGNVPDIATLTMQAEIKAVDEITQGLEKEKGVSLYETDPEFAKHIRRGMTKFEYTRAYEKALDEKLMRERQNPVGNIPSTGGQVSQNTALMAEYQEKLSKVRRGDVNAIVALKMDYRKRGLPI